MEANLHLHSRYSDGSLWPAEIAARAAALGLRLVAVTDHDSLGGVPEFLAAAQRLGIEAVAGCEIDCSLPELGYRSELLAYFPGAGDAAAWSQTGAFLRRVARAREERLRLFIERARVVFCRPDLAFEELLARKIGPRPPEQLDRTALSFSKVDLYEYLKALAVVEPGVGYREFRKAYFDSGLIRDGRFHRAAIEEVVAPVHADGGVLVIPHLGHEFDDSPDRMRAELPRLRRLLGRFRELGIEGVELYWYRSEASAALNDLVRHEADKFGFFFTYGSDCHGPGSQKHTLGQFSGDFAGFPGQPPLCNKR